MVMFRMLILFYLNIYKSAPPPPTFSPRRLLTEIPALNHGPLVSNKFCYTEETGTFLTLFHSDFFFFGVFIRNLLAVKVLPLHTRNFIPSGESAVYFKQWPHLQPIKRWCSEPIKIGRVYIYLLGQISGFLGLVNVYFISSIFGHANVCWKSSHGLFQTEQEASHISHKPAWLPFWLRSRTLLSSKW